MTIASNIYNITKELPEGVKLIAISKTKPAEEILEAYNAGQKIFGENKVQELLSKYEALPKDIEWHFIGHLQTNKVKYITPFIQYIHSVDSIGLLREINKQAEKNNRIIKCLLQVHIATEETKFGLDENELIELITSVEFSAFNNITICGLMGMATNTENENQIRTEFKKLSMFLKRLQNSEFANNNNFKELSMGMSSDYPLAIEEGSTIVRVGSKIFGDRKYK